MPVKDSELQRVLGFPQGLDNLSAETDLPMGKRGPGGAVVGSLRVAENVDLTDTGKVSTRDGFALVASLAGLHSGWADPGFDYALAVYNGYLVRFDTALTRTNVVALSSPLEPMSYAFHAGWVYYSNGFDSGRFNGQRRQEWAILPPLGIPTLAVQATIGGLDAGTYQIAVTYLDDYGRESGSSEYDEIDVPQGGGVLLTAIPQTSDPDVTTIRVYATEPNGTTACAVQDLPIGTATFLLGRHTPGKALDTEFQEPLPAGHIVRFHNGRQYVFRNRDLFWSEALHPGQGKLQTNYLRLNARGDLLEGVGEGPQAALYVAAGKRTYLLSGPDPKDWSRRVAHPHGAVPGSSAQVDITAMGLQGSGRTPFWLDDDGQFVVGTPAGVQPLHKERYAAKTGVQRAATVFRESGGVRHVLSVLKGGQAHGLAVSDSADAQVWSNGVRIS